jgi:hypothetical protein
MPNTGCLKEIATMTFDPLRYEATTREQWQVAAEACHPWRPALEDWLGAAIEQMLDIAGIRPRSHVLHPCGLLAAGGAK